ncbi:MAG: histidinol-phosphatase [Verrucomicrobiales bacterium]
MPPQPIYYDSHMHTPLCRHAEGEPEAYAEIAKAAGLRGIVFTCHSPMPDGWFGRVRMTPDEFPDYLDLVARATKAYRDDPLFEVKVGLESDFFPGMEGWLADLHAKAPLHHVLGSVHYFGPEYIEKYWQNDLDRFYATYFDHLAAAAESGLFDTLAHPDLIKNFEPDAWSFDRVRHLVEPCLDRIAGTGVAMELNTSGRKKAYPEVNPGPEFLELMCEREIPVIIGSDAHTPQRAGDSFLRALEHIENAGYWSVAFFDRRNRVDVPIKHVRESLWAAMGYVSPEAEAV